MRACEAMIAWTPAFRTEDPMAGKVKIGYLLSAGEPDWTAPYAYTGGAAHMDRRALRGDASIKMLFVDFHTLVVRDGISLEVAHDAFLAIDDYAEVISSDIAGASISD